MLATVVGGHAAAFSVIVGVVFIAFPHFLRWRSADGHRCLVTFVPTGVSGSSDGIIATITFSIQDFALSLKVYTFAPMNVKSVTYSIQTLQRNSKFFASFYAIYLVNPNNCVTHTHTHTQERDQYKGTRDARVIYNINTYKQRVCKKFFINFLHALFACINERIYAQKNGMISFHSK